jgi:hypothetical protein
MLPSDLSFVNETRLRNGVEELEALERNRHTVVIHDSHTCDLIKKHLDVEVYSFRFSSVLLRGILSAIRIKLADKLQNIGPDEATKSTTLQAKNEDILELRPNIYGIGINLRALWKKLIG